MIVSSNSDTAIKRPHSEAGVKKKLNYEFRLKMFIWYAIILLSPWMFVSLHIDTT